MTKALRKPDLQKQLAQARKDMDAAWDKLRVLIQYTEYRKAEDKGEET